MLNVVESGRGAPLVMLHGWGLHSGIWNGIVRLLEPHRRCIRIDLPGHGGSGYMSGSLDEWAAACRAVAPAGAVWLGWSLGGMVAMAAALQAPADINALLLAATTPRFVTAPDWPHAVEPEVLARFAADLRADWRATVADFLVLQTLGGTGGTEVLRTLKRELTAVVPEPAGLAAGLQILERADLRAAVSGLEIPARVLAGQRDRLTPVAAGRALAASLRAPFEQVARAAHAPFVSHPAVFARWILGDGANRRDSGQTHDRAG